MKNTLKDMIYEGSRKALNWQMQIRYKGTKHRFGATVGEVADDDRYQ